MKNYTYFIFVTACICAVSSDTYYYLSKEKKSWFDARNYCAKHGAHLVVINSEEEANILRSLMAPYTQEPWFLIGFNDFEIEGKYHTVTGLSLSKTGYNKWDFGEPSKTDAGTGVEEDCGSMSRNALLNDYGCNFKRYFICEKEL
ncbi:Hemolymph lipopolysaccharide-binding protein [Blattella germanica]|nr:Hemolymph lipopolysaccharide-binding protein [Blattella germanica]